MAIVLRPQGKLDLIGAGRLQHDVNRYILSNKHASPLWIVDLSQVKTISHAGLLLLTRLQRLAEKRRSRLILQHPTAAVRAIFEAALVTEYFEVQGDEDEEARSDRSEEATDEALRRDRRRISPRKKSRSQATTSSTR
ncbi:STAS domain-containing protein [Baaleninema simplex]|uniref:STAS domain-containing protein n=1 Tax=Baaleninema simplex TaxID=2862350 RepID=UPI00034759AA|nr:STAS domain-containing protein [Baaleninema simplex]